MSASRIDQYRSYLDRTGCRLTRERQLAAEIILSLDGPYVSEAVCEEVLRRSMGKSMSRATVYRVLHQLQDSGLIRLDQA